MATAGHVSAVRAASRRLRARRLRTRPRREDVGRHSAGSGAGRGPTDRGSAVVEFLGIALVLLIPLVYLVLTLGRIQGATFAAEGAAREAGRVIAQAAEMDDGVARARVAVELAFADQGMTVDADDVLHLTCERDPCLTPGGQVHVEVATAVVLPLVPEFARGVLPLEVGVRAEHLAAVPEFGPAP